MRLTFCFLLLALLPACHSTRNFSPQQPENYFSFYQRFHQDSLFQIQRTRFPLDGYAIEGGNISPWKKEEWIMHKNGLENIDSQIYQTQRIERPGLMQEKIFQPDSGVLIERHFSLLQNRWFLTFYLYVFL